MTGCTITISNGPAFTRTFIRDPYRKHLITVVSNCFDGVSVHSTSYAHDFLSRRTNIVMTAQTGTNMLSCSYNARNEVTGVMIDTNDYAYIYDNIGNSLYTSLNSVTNDYTVNNLNQYKAVTNLVDLTGYKLQFDADGNMTKFDGHSLSYDAENRLAAYMFGLNPSATGTVRSAYLYDHLGRRVKKMVQECREKDMGGIGYFTYWHTNEVTAFVYDGWNLVYERVAHTNGTVDEIEYAWGLDLSGTPQGTGGVGGLLFEKRNGVIYIPCYDANGNVTAYVDINGVVMAYRQYDAFGNTIAKGGDMVDAFHFWFSTKYLDHDTGLYYYGYRFYSPMLQRWINRDPIEEKGGLNLYGFVENSSISSYDAYGLWKLSFIGRNWLGNVMPVIEAFNSTKADMPIIMNRLRDWMKAAANLPDKCQFKLEFQRELVRLYAVLLGMDMGLNSNKELRLYSEKMSVNDDAKVWYRDKWFLYREYTGQISFNNSCKNDHRKWGPESMRSAIFHELTHLGGSPDDENTSEWWSDNAHNVTTLSAMPDRFGMAEPVRRAIKRAGGDGCCPKYIEWAPQ